MFPLCGSRVCVLETADKGPSEGAACRARPRHTQREARSCHSRFARWLCFTTQRAGDARCRDDPNARRQVGWLQHSPTSCSFRAQPRWTTSARTSKEQRYSFLPTSSKTRNSSANPSKSEATACATENPVRSTIVGMAVASVRDRHRVQVAPADTGLDQRQACRGDATEKVVCARGCIDFRRVCHGFGAVILQRHTNNR